MTRRALSGCLNSEHGLGGLLSLKSQPAWPKKLNMSTNLPPIVNNDDLDRATRSGQGQVTRWLPSNRVAPLNDDITDDVDRQERRHHSRGRKKCRRHRHDEQQLQTLVNSDSPTGGHQSSDT